MRNKRILFVATISRTIEAFLVPHIRYFLKKGYQVGAAANLDGHQLHQLQQEGVTLHHVSFSRTVFAKNNAAAYSAIKKVIQQYDILHVHTPIASFLTRLASSKKHYVIYMAHGFHFNENGGTLTNTLYKLGEAAAGLKTTKLVVTNTDDRDAARTFMPKKKIHFVHGVGLNVQEYDQNFFSMKDRQQLKQELGLRDDRKVLTHIAEFNSNKRQIDLIEACRLLKEKTSDFTLLLVGHGDQREYIQQQIAIWKLEDHVRCLGFRKDIPAILSVTDIGLLVSIREGLPRSVMEMMAMQVPVVATNIRGCRDLVDHEQTGFLVPIKSPLHIAECCFQLITDENKAKAFGEKARKKVEQQFSIETVLKELESIYPQ